MFRSCRRRCTHKREVLSKPHAGNLPVGFDERDVERGHGETIEAPPNEGVATDMFYLTPPRHISSLPKTDFWETAASGAKRTPARRSISMNKLMKFRYSDSAPITALRPAEGHRGSGHKFADKIPCYWIKNPCLPK
jgi:hypothetical protein